MAKTGLGTCLLRTLLALSLLRRWRTASLDGLWLLVCTGHGGRGDKSTVAGWTNDKDRRAKPADEEIKSFHERADCSFIQGCTHVLSDR
jgi:hypothetical protein